MLTEPLPNLLDVRKAAEIEDVILRCPTGALTVDYEDGSHVEFADPENTVHVAYNGPLFLRGDLSIDDAPSNAPGLKFRAALCRCGKSRNKPYCDNSHKKDEFQDYGAVGETGDDNGSRGGTLNVQPIKDGPASSTRSARAATVTATARPSSLSQYEARHRRLEDLKHGDSGGRTPRGNLVNVLARKGKAYEDPAIDARDEAYWRRRLAEERRGLTP